MHSIKSVKKHKAELHEINFIYFLPRCLHREPRNYKFLFESQCENFDFYVGILNTRLMQLQFHVA